MGYCNNNAAKIVFILRTLFFFIIEYVSVE